MEHRFRIRRGLNIGLSGAPRQAVEPGRPVTSVAILPHDHVGLRARLLVQLDERVRTGQPVVASRDNQDVVLTAPGSGRIAEIDRGPRRVLRAVVIELDAQEEWVALEATGRDRLASLDREMVTRRLLVSGLWPAIRARPFGGVAIPGHSPRALFVTAIDTDPLAPLPEAALQGDQDAFEDGLVVLGRLFDGPLYLCVSEGSRLAATAAARVTVARFRGPHPAGLPGTHIHLLAPAGRGRPAWHVGYRDVAAIGRLFTSGRLPVERIVSLGGPRIQKPRLVRTRLGASLDELLDGELRAGPARIVSGSVLSGRQTGALGRYLGRFHRQVTALAEPAGPPRPGLPARFLRPAGASDTTALHGRPAPLLPIGDFERVLPLDLLPTPLLRALLAGDPEEAEKLGCLELEEEDLALCTFVCAGKINYGEHLRRVLDELERVA